MIFKIKWAKKHNWQNSQSLNIPFLWEDRQVRILAKAFLLELFVFKVQHFYLKSSKTQFLNKGLLSFNFVFQLPSEFFNILHINISSNSRMDFSSDHLSLTLNPSCTNLVYSRNNNNIITITVILNKDS